MSWFLPRGRKGEPLGAPPRHPGKKKGGTWCSMVVYSSIIRPFTKRALSEVCTMQSTTTKRYYSPQFSSLAAVSVRRLAWALGVPMTATVDTMVKLIPSLLDPSKICLSCKDTSKCQSCVFRTQPTQQEQSALLAAL